MEFKYCDCDDRQNISLKIFKALSDETRLKIVELLIDNEKCVCEIFPAMNRTQSTISIQLSKLEKAGILASRRAGKKIFYRINDYRICDIFKALGYDAINNQKI
jgi:ArsR family transcriptional regulator